MRWTRWDERRGGARSAGGARGALAQPGDDAERLAEVVEELVALTEAGVTPEAAWAYLREFSAHPLVGRVAGGIAEGERIGEALTQAARAAAVELSRVLARSRPGARTGVAARARSPADGSVRVLAAVWHVADAAGAPLGATLRSLAGALHDRAETEREIQVALAGPRATARLVSWLPGVGMVLAVAMGVDLVGTMTGSAVGWGLSGGGVLLLVLGRQWMQVLMRRAQPSSDAPGLRHDLLAVALSGGLGVQSALVLCDEAWSGPEGSGLGGGLQAAGTGRSGGSLLAAGTDEGDRLDAVRILALAQRSGAPAVDLLRSAAARARRRRRLEGRSDAAALAVRSMLPLGACVLPSFMLLGVAPIVLSIVSSTVGAF